MRHYFLVVFFLIALVATIIQRIIFERKEKHLKDEEFRSLYPKHNTLLIALFFYCLLMHGEEVYHLLFNWYGFSLSP